LKLKKLLQTSPSKDVPNRLTLQEERRFFGKAFSSVVFQRNVIYLMMLAAFVSILINLTRVYDVSTTKELNPFVIQIDNRSGTTKVVHEVSREKYSHDPVVQNYLIKRYMLAREQFFPSDYRYKYFQVVRSMSAPWVFNYFFSYLNYHRDPNPKNRSYEKGNIIHMDGMFPVRSNIESINIMNYDEQTKKFKAQVRFVQSPYSKLGVAKAKYYKIATIEFDFLNDKLTDQDRILNPLGFRVLSYGIVLENI